MTASIIQRGLRTTAEGILTGNDRGTYIAPGPHQYPGQWNWDAALVTIGLAHIDPPRARHEALQLLRGQWRDGMVPHIVFWDQTESYFPGPGVWNTEGMAGAPTVAVTGISQPPVLASAIRILHERDPDIGFLERVVPAIEEWHCWLDKHRRRRSGLVTIFHPWESGTDNSPRFDDALGRAPKADRASLSREDTRHVPPAQRPTTDDYQHYLGILETLRQSDYRPELDAAIFAYGDVGFTSILARAELDLVELWGHLGETGAAGRMRERSLTAALGDAWDPATRRFLDQDLRTGKPVTGSAECLSGLLPLYAGGSDPDQTAEIVNALWDPGQFGPSEDSPWGATSVAKTSPLFEPARYWRGPVWANMNWFLVRGLQTEGLHEEAARLCNHTLDLVARNGMFEYYHPRTGQGMGSRDFSWTAALTLDLLERQ